MEVITARSTPPGQKSLAEADAKLPGRMRLHACSYLHRWRLERLSDTVALLITELMTNGLRYGHADSIGLRLIRTSRTVRIEVADGTPGTPVLRMPSTAEECGRGLFLVESFADVWGVRDGGAVIWCELPLTEEAPV
ncbi:ATP-binding protein [Streptomyces sp. NBC_01022]|uniref:ATP-binding protein n=1 Tax=Streptomyces sp. NBC_01022 TaxID=2903723 RepID=UPI002DD969C3|nr:ATP-binding protein [Streptomyces sp. NBC_01022]WRZ79455.1 ATP-binding protein [Streptomyces sp. NBC_01022]WRZ86221.1 ATP-binding protein [Streptomyces sp. NBC_01022]